MNKVSQAQEMCVTWRKINESKLGAERTGV